MIGPYLGLYVGEEVLAVPIRLGDRVVNLLFVQAAAGCRLPDTMEGELGVLARRAAEVYHRLIVQRRG